MRRNFLLRSITRILGDEVTVHDAAYMWSRHRWMVPYAAIAFAGVVLFAPVAGIDDWPTRIVIGAAAVAVAVTATTEYWVLALSDKGLHLLAASKIRQVAVRHHENLDADTPVVPVGGTGLTTDWAVGDRRYTVPRSSEQAMGRMATSQST